MAETLITILAEHNVPINFADHFTKLVSNKLVFPDSAARAPCSQKVVIARIVTNFFSRNLTGVRKESELLPRQGLYERESILHQHTEVHGQSDIREIF